MTACLSHIKEHGLINPTIPEAYKGHLSAEFLESIIPGLPERFRGRMSAEFLESFLLTPNPDPETLEIWPNPKVEKPNHRTSDERHDCIHIAPNYVEMKGGALSGGCQSGGGTRGKVVEFSQQSRIRLMKNLSCYYDFITHWQHLTFADEIFDGLSFDERVELSSYRMKLFSQWFKRSRYAKDYGFVWRREYEPRKSGAYKGELLPHYHVMFISEKKRPSDLQVRCMCIECATKWTQINKGPRKMLLVNIHVNSYQRMNDPVHASRYVSKYVAKTTGAIFPEGVSLGRFWGKVGALPDVVIDQIHLTNRDSLVLRRYLRKLAKAKGYAGFLRYKNGDPDQIGSGFMFLSKAEFMRLLNFVLEKNGGAVNAAEYLGESCGVDWPVEEF